MLEVATSLAALPARTLDAGLLLGLMLLAAIIGGHAARLIRVPRVVGYLVAGVGLRFALASLFTQPEHAAETEAWLAKVAEPLQVIKTLALGLIMFIIGNVFETQHFKSVGSRVLRISLLETGFVVILVGIGCTAVWMWRMPEAGREALAAGLLLGAVAIATAPAATVLVLGEYDAKGTTSDTILTMTAVNNTVSIVLFHCLFLVLTAAGVIASTSTGDRLLWLDLLLTSVGSVVLGGALGFVFSVLYSKITLPEFLLIFFATFIGLGAGARMLSQSFHLSFNFLLTCLFLGAVFTNVTLNSGPLYDTLRTMSAPVFAAFFVIAGYELHIEELGHLGLLGTVYVTCRIIGKYVGARIGVRWARWSGELSPHFGLGLLCQAGVAIGLADFIHNAWVVHTPDGTEPHRMATHFKTIVLGSVVMFELLGPVVLKSVVKRAGEVKAITLLRRRRAAPAEGDSITRLTWQALLRMLGLRKTDSRGASYNLTVRHIMRSNIKFLRASAGLDEVLHFAEGSRYNHFPVVDENGNFAGMIHFSDLRDIIYDPHMRGLVTAIDLASPDDMVPADLTLQELLARFQDTDVGSLVVVQSAESRRVVGLVEQRDLLRVLHGEAKAESN